MPDDIGIRSYGVYVPRGRLDRSEIATTLGTPAGSGTRSVASFDEDTTTMGVEAGRRALRGVVDPPDVRHLTFTTSAPAYLEKDNAATIHAALGLAPAGGAFDAVGSLRSAAGSLEGALASARDVPSLWISADVRQGLPGSGDERDGGDGAVAFLLGRGPDVIATPLARATRTSELLDRWRSPGEDAAHHWEERFGEQAYVATASDVLDEALGAVGCARSDVDWLVVAGASPRAARTIATGVGARNVVDDLAGTIGNLGVAHPAAMLALALDQAGPGELLAVVVLGDGIDVRLWRTTTSLPSRERSLRAALDAGGRDVAYASYLTWRGHLRREPPRRPEPMAPLAPAARRSTAWKFSFCASTCRCGTRHLPPQRVCLRCRSTDEMEAERMADSLGTVTSFGVDRLAPSPAPPVVVAVVDYDGGGRFLCEVADADAQGLAIGDRVEMTFRRFHSTEGIHNYFWKAAAVAGEGRS